MEAVTEKAVLKLVRGITREYGQGQDALIPVLQAVQTRWQYVPREALPVISRELRVPESEIHGVVTFYAQFRQTPVGRHIIRVCKGTACHVGGAEGISACLKELLGVAVDETTPDGSFTLQEVACLGCCSLAPVMMIDEEVYGHLDEDRIKKILGEIRNKDGAP